MPLQQESCGLNPKLGDLSESSLWVPSVLVYSGLLPPSKDIHSGLTGNSNLSVGVKVSADGRPILFVSPAINQPLAQGGGAHLHSNTAAKGSSIHATLSEVEAGIGNGWMDGYCKPQK